MRVNIFVNVEQMFYNKLGNFVGKSVIWQVYIRPFHKTENLVNIKQKDEWIALFKRHGFDYMRDANEVTSWGLLFVKNENHGKRK